MVVVPKGTKIRCVCEEKMSVVIHILFVCWIKKNYIGFADIKMGDIFH
jgi:hypothetical protein